MRYFLGHARLVLVATLVAMMAVGCLKKGKSGKAKNESNFQLVYYTQNPFANNQNFPKVLQLSLAQLQLAQGTPRGLNEESLWALAMCKCAPGFDGAYLKLLAQSRGALPQALVPSIREQIKNKSILKTLTSIGGSTLLNFFVRDETINKEVRKGLGEKLKRSIPGGTNVAEDLKIFFDLYANPYGNLGEQNATPPRTLAISQQASKWAFVLSLENMWGTDITSQDPLGYTNHGLQLLVTAQSISEWSYAFGLDETTNTQPYGGFAIDPSKGLRSALGPYDPRKTSVGSGILSGNYAVTFPQSSSLEMAMNTRETWAHSGDNVPLEEQARLWASAGLAYQRLKPSSRTAATQQIFAQDAIFPDDAHLLPLTFLPGLSTLLDGPFINTKDYLIRELAVIRDSVSLDMKQRASLKATARLARAMLIWNLALQNIDQDRLPASIHTQIKTSQAKLKDSLRLAVQTILDQYVETQSPTSRLHSIGMVESKNKLVKPDMATAAEALAVLAIADQTLFRSNSFQTDFQKKVIGLYHWFAADYLADIALTGANNMGTPEAALWTYTALSMFAQYPQTLHQAVWLNDAFGHTNAALRNWDARYKQ